MTKSQRGDLRLNRSPETGRHDRRIAAVHITDTPAPQKAETVLAQIAALQTKGFTELKVLWHEFFETEAPRYGLQFLRSRLSYRIQELAFGGLPEETKSRLDALADEIDQDLKAGSKRRRRAQHDRPIAGTRLIREWQGVEHLVTVCNDGYEYRGRPYKSLSAIARSITGTRWNGWAFFGLRSPAAGRSS